MQFKPAVFALWLSRHRADMSPDLLSKAERALLTLKHTRREDIERYEIVRRLHIADLRAFVEAFDAAA